jgi:3-dehydroquinate dehydratase type I
MEKSIDPGRANVVGVIHTADGFSQAGTPGLNAVEIRVDALSVPPEARQIVELPVAAIVTVRCAEEGGLRSMNDDDRLKSYLALLPGAAAIDLELRSAKSMSDLREAVLQNAKTLILSLHDFRMTPSLADLEDACAKMRDLGADILKIATKTESVSEVSRLLTLLERFWTSIAVALCQGGLGVELWLARQAADSRAMERERVPRVSRAHVKRAVICSKLLRFAAMVCILSLELCW